MREINLIVVHCSATPQNMDIGAEEIRQWHKDKGWSDIGYHYVIRRNGVIEHGRDLDHDGNVDEEVGAHAAGFNSNSLGICLIGGTDADDRDKAEANFTRNQYMALNALLLELCSLYTIPRRNVLGHRDLPGVKKACPCFDVQAFFNSPL